MTMGDIARCSLGRASDYYNEELLYRLFGVNAELLIDHAWGWEPCTIADIKAYKPAEHSVGSGQVLTSVTLFGTARLIAKEMAETLALDLVSKGLKTNRVALAVGYDTASLDPGRLDAGAPIELKRAAEAAAASYTGRSARTITAGAYLKQCRVRSIWVGSPRRRQRFVLRSIGCSAGLSIRACWCAG